MIAILEKYNTVLEPKARALVTEAEGLLKFIYSEKATKILRNLPLTFDYMQYIQSKVVEDFAKFCGLLRIYELY